MTMREELAQMAAARKAGKTPVSPALLAACEAEAKRIRQAPGTPCIYCGKPMTKSWEIRDGYCQSCSVSV